MFKIHRMLMAAALVVAATSSSQAAVIGQLGFSFTTAITISPTTFNSTPLTITGATAGVTTSATGDFTAVVPGTVTATPASFVAPSATAYTLTVTGFGTFTATSISIAPGATATNVQLILNGTFTKTGDPSSITPTTLTMAFQQTVVGGLVTGSGTLATVPEPSAIALAGIGVAAAGLFGLRKRFAK